VRSTFEDQEVLRRRTRSNKNRGALEFAGLDGVATVGVGPLAAWRDGFDFRRSGDDWVVGATRWVGVAERPRRGAI
jgi:hypothetical protein